MGRRDGAPRLTGNLFPGPKSSPRNQPDAGQPRAEPAFFFPDAMYGREGTHRGSGGAAHAEQAQIRWLGVAWPRSVAVGKRNRGPVALVQVRPSRREGLGGYSDDKRNLFGP